MTTRADLLTATELAGQISRWLGRPVSRDWVRRHLADARVVVSPRKVFFRVSVARRRYGR